MEESSNPSPTPNWCDMPFEIRLFCIKRMDFPSRMQLRATARLEKQLVELYKPHEEVLGLVNFGENNEIVGAYFDRDGASLDMLQYVKGNLDEGYQNIVESLVKYHRIDHLLIDGFIHDEESLLEGVGRVKQRPFHALSLGGLSNHNLHTAMENFGDGVELLSFKKPPRLGLQRVLRDPLIVPMLIGCRVMRFTEFDDVPINTIIALWLDHDKATNSKLIIFVCVYEVPNPDDDTSIQDNALASFSSEFSARVIDEYTEDGVVRIQMDDKSKHILMRVQNKNYEHGAAAVYLIGKVVEATLMASEYETAIGEFPDYF